MKKSLKRISLVIAIAMLLGTLLSCADVKDDAGSSGEWEGIGEWDGTRATTPDNLPKDLNFDGATISILHREGLQELECDMLAVACLDEAFELRRVGVTLPILCLGVLPL